MTNTQTSYTRAAVVGLADGDYMTRINQLATVDLQPTDVATFRGIVSRREVDTFGTVMEPPTLSNYAADYKRGLSLLDSHNHKALPIGRSFDATLRDVPQERNILGDPMQEVAVNYYIQRGVALPTNQRTDDFIKLIEGGTIRDLSIGFDYSVGNCSICGKNQLDYKANCRHAVLAEYDGKTCYQRVMNGHAMESSLVWSASCPKSYIERAQALQRSGDLSAPQIRQLEDRYHELINPRYGATNRSTNMANSDATEPTETTTETTTTINPVKALVQSTFTRAGAEISAANKTKIQAAISKLDDVETALDEAENILLALIGAAQESEAAEMGRFKQEVETRAVELTTAQAQLAEARAIVTALGDDANPDAVTRLKAQASDGRAYRAAKINAARTAYTQATSQDSEAMSSLFEQATIEQLEQLTSTWQGQSRATFSDVDGRVGNRQLDTPHEGVVKTVPNLVPAEAYQLNGRH